MNRDISFVLTAKRIIDDGDMRLYRALPSPERVAVGPFVFFDHYRHQSLRGIGDRPHPHAGIELISYVLEGGMEHRDSMGFRDRLGPGDAQWIRAGRGILHAEQPLSGRHGLQVWASLPPRQKFAEPAYRSWRASAIPEVDFPGAHIRVVAGSAAGVDGPVSLTTQATFAHVRLESGTTIIVPVDAAAELGVYVLAGGLVTASVGPVGKGSLALLTPGDAVVLTGATDQSTDLVIFGGAPAEGPILFSGPFVMGTEAEMAEAKRAYAAGEMGRLEGVPF
jgi:redox-sensitive bicupin YhaK (pirin superfamily)